MDVIVNKYQESDNSFSYEIKFDSELSENIRSLQNVWKKEIADNNPSAVGAPYFMSPMVGELISDVIYPRCKEQFQKISQKMIEQIDTKVVSVLYRVTVWDTYKLISRNAKMIAKIFSERAELEKQVNLRWICTGAGVAERSLITLLRAHHGFDDVRGISTDISAAAILVAACNLEMMNIESESSLIDVRIVFGTIPTSLQNKANTIILQIDDAVISLERDIEDGLRYDAFLADNALPYFTREEGNEILSSAVKLVNNKGIIQALGLNKNMFVKIPLGNKIKAILNKKIKQQYNMLMDEKQKKIGKEYQHGYRHIYIKNNQGVIIQVISEGAIEMFSWIRTYLSKLNLDYAMKLMKMVTIGTGLSSWGKYVQTNTIESYQDLLKLLANTNYTVVDHPGDDADWQDMVLSTFTVLVE